MIYLKDILQKIEVLKLLGSDEISISGIHFDSREVSEGAVFVAVKGVQADGHKFIDSAIEKGAQVIVCEELPSDIKSNITFVQVKDSQLALGLLSSAYFGTPSSKLKLVGVTGTNGKTTTATLLYNVFKAAGFKVGLLSTVANYVDTKELSATHTTPDPVQLNRLMAEMIELGCEFCFMEISSHAIHQKRIAGLHFIGGLFSNITHDHLDYHKTFKEYIKAKKAFFDGLPSNAFALVNNDDKNGNVMVQNCDAHVYKYALKSMADFNAKIMEQDLNGMQLRIENNEIWTRFLGEFNGYNLLSVYATSVLLGLEKMEVLPIISELKPVNGRFEYMNSPNGFTAIIDYAHTPDALLNVLQTVQKVVNGGEIITVVGTGGNRDKGKRPVMARIATEFSNKVVLTSDNPRNEEPEDIIKDMEEGVEVHQKRKVLTIINRKEAIKTACMLAGQGDIVLVAGKGHETYQEIKGVRHHFDDKEVVAEVFKNIN